MNELKKRICELTENMFSREGTYNMGFRVRDNDVDKFWKIFDEIRQEFPLHRESFTEEASEEDLRDIEEDGFKPPYPNRKHVWPEQYGFTPKAIMDWFEKWFGEKEDESNS